MRFNSIGSTGLQSLAAGVEKNASLAFSRFALRLPMRADPRRYTSRLLPGSNTDLRESSFFKVDHPRNCSKTMHFSVLKWIEVVRGGP